MTKTQSKAQIRKLAERLIALNASLFDFISDLSYCLDELTSDLNEIAINLEDKGNE